MFTIPSRYTNFIVYNSITNTLDDDKLDTVQPFSFIEYLNYTKSLDKNIIEFSDYQVYLEKWNATTTVGYTDIGAEIKKQFTAFLKTITLNYTTSEEKRYLSNIDFNSPNDLEIAVPFYSAKIKQVLLYFAEKRDTYKIDFELAKNKGTIDSVESFLKTYVVETLFGNDNPTFSNLKTPLSAVVSEVQIEVEEGYDIFNDYFDLDPFEPPQFYKAKGNRARYFGSNTNYNDGNLFVNYDQAIVDLINSEKVVLQEIPSLVMGIGSPVLSLLQNYDFLDYKTKTREYLKLQLDAELIKKFTGTDFYYLSTNALGHSLSGKMFDSTEPYSNLLNLHNPATLTVPAATTRYERDVGLFFKPTIRGMVQLQTPFTYYKKEDLKPDYLYIFPDPESFGNVSGVSKKTFESPLNIKLEGEKIQKNISSGNAYGNTNVSDRDFTFESYSSQEQQSKYAGIATGFYNYGVVNQYTSDLFGNVIVGFKNYDTAFVNNFATKVTYNLSQLGLSASTETLYLCSIENLYNGTLNGTQSILATAPVPVTSPSIYQTRNSVGNFFIFNAATDKLVALSSEFENVFNKYPAQLNDLQNYLVNVEVYKDTYVFTTSSYTIIDKVIYDEGSFYKSPNIPLIFLHEQDNEVSNVFLVDDTLYVAKLYLDKSQDFYLYNERPFIFRMYSYDIKSHTGSEVLTGNNTTFIYEANTKVNVNSVKLVYNRKNDTFNIGVDIKDSNLSFFLHNIQCRIKSGLLYIIKDKFFTPSNDNFTVNFFDFSNTEYIEGQTIASTPTINNLDGTITF